MFGLLITLTMKIITPSYKNNDSLCKVQSNVKNGTKYSASATNIINHGYMKYI